MVSPFLYLYIYIYFCHYGVRVDVPFIGFIGRPT